ncbi:hypothetical protein BY996DRAFT_6421848 [Phakopsora pachyrhizi]|nr:hypothetical protein BY996DRAFT_6421848 [Phakopsora pachyrhizi]
MSHGLGPTEKLRVTERVQWKQTVIVRWWCWWKLYGNLWAVPDLCLEVIGTEPSLSSTNSGYSKDPAAVSIVIANPVPVDLVADYPAAVSIVIANPVPVDLVADYPAAVSIVIANPVPVDLVADC